MAIVSTLAIFPESAGPQNLKRFADAGGMVAVGTDFGCCNQSAGIGPFMEELQLMHSEGFKPDQIMLAATQNGAEVSNVGGQVGSLKPGKLADILVVEGDPLEDLNALGNVIAVLKSGRIALHTTRTAGKSKSVKLQQPRAVCRVGVDPCSA